MLDNKKWDILFFSLIKLIDQIPVSVLKMRFEIIYYYNAKMNFEVKCEKLCERKRLTLGGENQSVKIKNIASLIVGMPGCATTLIKIDVNETRKITGHVAYIYI